MVMLLLFLFSYIHIKKVLYKWICYYYFYLVTLLSLFLYYYFVDAGQQYYSLRCDDYVIYSYPGY